MTKKATKAVAAKKKLTIADLQPKPQRITITNEAHGIETWVELIGREESLEFALLQFQLQDRAEDGNIRVKSLKEQVELNAALMAATLVAWDEDNFGMEFSIENATKLFCIPTNFWIREQIQKHLDEKSSFLADA